MQSLIKLERHELPGTIQLPNTPLAQASSAQLILGWVPADISAHPDLRDRGLVSLFSDELFPMTG